MTLLASINAETSLWNDPRLAAFVAASAVALMIATVWLMRRKSRDGRGAATICLILSIALHGLLIYFLPTIRSWNGGSMEAIGETTQTGFAQVSVANFDPTFETADSASSVPETTTPQTLVAPLPLPTSVVDVHESKPTPMEAPDPPSQPVSRDDTLPSALVASTKNETKPIEEPAIIDDLLSQWLSDDSARAMASEPMFTNPSASQPTAMTSSPEISQSNSAHIPGVTQNDFGQRAGDAKRMALLGTGGDDSTEAAVEAALRFLAADQRADGAWDPATSGAGRETKTLGTDRGGAGKRATNGITGLALLSMLGAGNTHLEGPYAENVRRGLSYLIRSQQPDGSLAGSATVYEANYCHGMAALAMCEAAAITGDESAIRSAAAAVGHTMAGQHPTTGGWRYVKGDQGDLSQLGWQAMVLDGGRRASITVAPHSFSGAAKFLRSVRAGQNGGLASYRPGEAPSRTMTAEALATRLLLGEKIPANEISEAEAFLLRQPPGVGKDNYYGWYYTSLALHQLQDDAWREWNTAMKSHLLSRQLSSGSWPTDDEWGGYGGRVYSTATASLCLEVYYRHALRKNAVAAQPSTAPTYR